MFLKEWVLGRQKGHQGDHLGGSGSNLKRDVTEAEIKVVAWDREDRTDFGYRVSENRGWHGCRGTEKRKSRVMLNLGLCSWVPFIEMGKTGPEIDLGEIMHSVLDMSQLEMPIRHPSLCRISR